MAMQRARRLVTVAAVASLAVCGLSACRNEPSVAAYVGQSKLTEARVDAVLDEAHDKLAAAAAAQQPGKPVAVPITRADVVRALLGAQVLEAVAKQRNLTLPADLGLANYAQAVRLPENTEYVRLFAETDAYVKLLRQSVQSAAEPTEADLREVFDVLEANGQSGGTFESFKTQLPEQNKQLVQTAVAVRKEITEVSSKLDITVNPKYQPAGVPVLQFQTSDGQVKPLISAPLGKDDAAPVTELH